MKYETVLRAFYTTPLAILPEKAAAIARFLHTKAAGGEVDPAEVRALVAAREEKAEVFAAPLRRAEDGTLRAGKVGVLPVFGVLSQRVGEMQAMSGGISTEAIGAALDRLLGNADVKSIVMAYDSPGGSVFGVQELGEKIRAGRDRKKIVGLADSVAASAAYWLISQSSEVAVTPGGQVGSIGVFAAHEDWSVWEQQEGIKTTLISAGKFKTEGHPYGPLTDEARVELQAKVDHYYGEFIAAVAKGRGVSASKVRADFGEGRMVTAADAVAKGMADRIATLDQVLKRLGAHEGGTTPGAAMARARAVEVDAEQ